MKEETEKKQDQLLKAYSSYDEKLRAALDAKLGITRSIVYDPERNKYKTGCAVIRDATQAESIAKNKECRCFMEATNMLLRVLVRLRGIDYALKKQAENAEMEEEVNTYNNRRKILKTSFEELDSQAFQLAESGELQDHPGDFDRYKQSIFDVEAQFNTEWLCDALHEAHLDEGCSSQADHEELLFHYRNLSALIDPAKTLVTICYDSDKKVIHRITQDPIAQKLSVQVAAIGEEMSQTCLYPTPDKRNFQTSQKLAMQIANSCFADLARSDDRMLGAQARKTHLYGAKNAFFVTNELLFVNDEFDLPEDSDQRREKLMGLEVKEEGDRQYFARSATPVYIGGGETEARVQQCTRDNIEQIRQFVINKFELKEEEAKQLKIHYTCLVTDSFLEGQDRMIRHAYNATRRNEDSRNDISYIPCNWDGTHRRLDLATKIEIDNPPSTAPTPSNQAARYRQAVQVSVSIRGKKEVFELVTCASGQDRTGGESEAATLAWVRKQYEVHGKEMVTVDSNKGDSAEQARAKGRNAAEINGHMLGGSPGCKKDSRGRSLIGNDSLFSPETDRLMYLDSADTNKNNKVNVDYLKTQVTHKPSPIAEEQYKSAHKKLSEACGGASNNGFKVAGKKVFEEVERAKQRIPYQDLGVLIRTLEQAALVVKRPEQRNSQLVEHPHPTLAQAAAISRLGVIAKELNKKSLLKKVSGALLVLGGVALVAAGILFAIPSGGSSLLATVLGAKAIAVAAVTLGLQTTIAVGATTTLLGATATYAGHKVEKKNTRRGIETEHGLIKAITELDKQQAKKESAEEPFFRQVL